MNEFLREMAAICIVQTAVEMLLPEGKMRQTAKTLMGLVLLVTMLTSLKALAAEVRGYLG